MAIKITAQDDEGGLVLDFGDASPALTLPEVLEVNRLLTEHLRRQCLGPDTAFEVAALRAERQFMISRHNRLIVNAANLAWFILDCVPDDLPDECGGRRTAAVRELAGQLRLTYAPSEG